MSDASIAEIARRLAEAMTLRAKHRQADDSKKVALLQRELCAEWAAEKDPCDSLGNRSSP